jgi:predicted O-methyltransferase YrrM
MKKLWLAFRYMVYLSKAKTRYVIHSPFVFELLNNVFKDETIYLECSMPDRTLQKYKRRKDKIDTTDFGKKAGNKEFIIFQSSVGKIVSKRSHTVKQLHLLFRISKYFNPKTILEFGTAAGTSTLYLSAGAPKAKVVTMEGCAGLALVAKKCFEKRNLNNIEVFPGNFNASLPLVLENINVLDMVFFDGNHREKPTLDYFNQCIEHSDENSVFIFDDIHWSPGMERAWNKIKADGRVSITIDLFWAGLVFFRKGIAKQDFVIRY